MLIKGRLCSTRVVQGPQGGGALLSLPGISPSSLQTGEGRGEGAELAVFVGQSWKWRISLCLLACARSHGPGLLPREAGDAVQLCAQGGKGSGFGGQLVISAPSGAPHPSRSRLTMSFDLTESAVCPSVLDRMKGCVMLFVRDHFNLLPHGCCFSLLGQQLGWYSARPTIPAPPPSPPPPSARAKKIS